MRGALAQIAAAAEQAHKDAQLEGQDSHERQGGAEGSATGVSGSVNDVVETEGPASGQDAQVPPVEDEPVKTRSRKATEKKSSKKAGEKSGDKADKKPGKKAAKNSEEPAEQQSGEAPQGPADEKPVRRTRRRATATSTAPSPENSSDIPEASA